MTSILQNPSQADFVAAIEENVFEFFKLWGGWSRMEVHDNANWLWGISDIPFPLFNFVLHANFPPSEVNTHIEAAVARCQERRVPMLWWTGPMTRPADLQTHLFAHGFLRASEMPGMALDLRTWDDTQKTIPGLVIEQVLDDSTAQIWNHTLMLGFELPEFVEPILLDSLAALKFAPDVPLRHYLARLNGEPVATVSMFLDGSAGLYNIATLPNARGQGIGTAITAAPLRIARAEGYQVAILHASSMGHSLYRRMGFSEYCKINQYVWSPEQDPAFL